MNALNDPYSVMDGPTPVIKKMIHEIRNPYYNFNQTYAFGYGDSDKARGLCGKVVEAYADYAVITFTGEIIREDNNGYALANVILHDGSEGEIYAKLEKQNEL